MRFVVFALPWYRDCKNVTAPSQWAVWIKKMINREWRGGPDQDHKRKGGDPTGLLSADLDHVAREQHKLGVPLAMRLRPDLATRQGQHALDHVDGQCNQTNKRTRQTCQPFRFTR